MRMKEMRSFRLHLRMTAVLYVGCCVLAPAVAKSQVADSARRLAGYVVARRTDTVSERRTPVDSLHATARWAHMTVGFAIGAIAGAFIGPAFARGQCESPGCKTG